MMLPYQYMIDYKGFTIHCLNGIYTIANKASLSFLSMTEAKKQVDIYEQQYLLSTNQLFDNQTTSDAETTNAER